MAGAHRNPLLIQQGTQIMWVCAFQQEGKHPSLALCPADQANVGIVGGPIKGCLQQLVFMVGHQLAVKLIQIVDGRCQADGATDIGGAGFKVVPSNDTFSIISPPDW